MKARTIEIKFDKDSFLSGEKVTGYLVVQTHDENWKNCGKVFIKFFDKLNVQWVQDERVRMAVSSGVAKVVFKNFKKPFQINNDLLPNCISSVKSVDNGFVEYKYRFEFNTPALLQGTLDLENAKCQYFVKAFLSTDETVKSQYQSGVNVFDDSFRTLNHAFHKQEISIFNPIAKYEITSDKNVYEAKSANFKVTVTLPKLVFTRGETIPVQCKIEHVEDMSRKIELHKISFVLLQVVKLFADEPCERSRLFDKLIIHTTRKHLQQNYGNAIVLNEYIQIPNDVEHSSTRSLNVANTDKSSLNAIRINYRLSLEFWKNFLVNELNIDIPLLIDPEA